MLEEEKIQSSEVLEQVSFEANDGELVGVIGAVGSGKTSLLLSLAGETELASGIAKKNGSIAYVEQDPFIISGTIRENIQFGHLHDERFLSEVLAASALASDLESMPEGLDKLVGERGISLSGGQRARVSLARALYSKADIYLLDDPLSAVDTRVSKRIFEDAIKTFLRHKCVVLATHRIEYLPEFDRVY